MKLYEFSEAFRNLIDPETGEVKDFAALESLQTSYAEKLDSCIKVFKTLKYQANALGEEIKSMQQRKKSAERSAEKLLLYIERCTNGQKFSSISGEITYRKSTKLVIPDESKVPEEFMKFEPSVNKQKVKDSLKSGQTFDWCNLEETESIVIK